MADQPSNDYNLAHLWVYSRVESRITFPDSSGRSNKIEKENARERPDKISGRINSFDSENFGGQEVEEFHFGPKPEDQIGQEVEEFHFGPKKDELKGQEVEEINFGSNPEEPKGQEVEEFHFGPKKEDQKGQEVEEINFGSHPEEPKGQEVEEFHFGPKKDELKGQEVEEINFGTKKEDPKGQEVEEFHFGPKKEDQKGQEVEEINFGSHPEEPKGQEVEEFHFGPKKEDQKGQEVEEINFGTKKEDPKPEQTKPENEKGQEVEEINFGYKPEEPKGQETEEFNFVPKEEHPKEPEIGGLPKPKDPKNQETEEINFGYKPEDPKGQEIEEFDFKPKPDDPKGQEVEEFHFIPKPEDQKGQEVEEINFGSKPKHPKEEEVDKPKPENGKGQEVEEINFGYKPEEPKGQESEEFNFIPKPEEELEEINYGHKPKHPTGQETEDLPFETKPEEPKGLEDTTHEGHWFDIFLPSPAEGCEGKPEAPANSLMKCDPHRKCTVTCNEGFKFPDSREQLVIDCEGGKWVSPELSENVKLECKPVCLPPCQNDGICIAPNQCDCPKNFEGSQCQFGNKPCSDHPPVPQNSLVHCNASDCVIECYSSYSFPDGSLAVNLICHQGEWTLRRTDWNVLPDCKPSCHPPCVNGGSCLDYNKCQCPRQYTGPQCQYEISACSGEKLNFNGFYTCKSKNDAVSCSLTCPEGHISEFPLAAEYICEYSTGKFLPEPVPKCTYDKNTEVVKFMSSSHTVQNGFDTYEISKVGNHPVDETGECVSWKQSHYKNFDGAVFSFNGDCSYTLVQDTNGEIFRIAVVNSKCETKPCRRYLKIFYQDKESKLGFENSTPYLNVNDVSQGIPYHDDGLSVVINGNSIFASLQPHDVNLFFNSEDRLSVKVNRNMQNKTGGLCGNFNGEPRDDFRTPDGSPAWDLQVFVQSWVNDPYSCQTTCDTKNSCKGDSDLVYCRKIFTGPHFEKCFNVEKFKNYLESCIWDICDCGKSCACDTISEFAENCKKYLISEGLPDTTSDWRQIAECPWNCPPGKVYSYCGPSIQPACGSLGVDNSIAKYSECVEGCFCPEGMVLSNDSCVTREHCHCQWRNVNHKSGEKIVKDCNTCTCQNGEWVCTNLKCDSRCSLTGGPHYVTFDGRKYDFLGQCSYYLLKTDNYTVESENYPCSRDLSDFHEIFTSYNSEHSFCGKTITIVHNTDEIKLKKNREVVVNGAEVSSFPVELNGVVIRMASSIYLIVKLPGNTEVWWDGNSNVYIDVPGSHEGSTGGLCGTFNNNQKDDFKTPEGDTEQSTTAFAEKWKTDETCTEVIDPYKSHPCDSNVKSKILAEKYCQKLKEGIFKDCHPHVDVEPFYKNCLYDICACQRDVKSCFCPIFADYGNECGRRNVEVPWRSEMRECGLHCPPGQVYQPCADSCGRSCLDISLTKGHCVKKCAEGCGCPDGLVLSSTGQCIPISTCHCIHQHLKYKANHQLIMESNDGPQFCTCENALWSCRPATKLEIDRDYENSDVKCNDTLHEEYTTCEPAEPKTCKNMHEKPKSTTRICFPGCVCKKGYVWDSIGKICVNASECPCHHGGRSYADGEKIQEDCNTCTCKNGLWACTERECSAICSTWGDSHFKTFDGRIYDFQGSCEFVLAAGSISDDDSFMVYLEIVPCGSTGISCPKSVSLKVGSPQKEEEVVFRKSNPSAIPKGLKRIAVREAGLFIFAEIFDLGITVQWDKGTRVYVRADSRWRNRVKGLCGNFNSNELDDFKTPTSGETSEISPVLFADSWRLQTYCPESYPIVDTCARRPHRKAWSVAKCSILKSETFEACHSEVPFEPHFERCITDTCGCDEGGDCECMCTAIAAYAEECTLRGVPIKWRTQKFCGLQCEDTNSVYSPCMSTCPPKSCENQYKHSALLQTCHEESCVEGCERPHCPVGHVLADSSSTRCIPLSSCKTVCLTVNNVTYLEGDLMESDDCHSCYCSHHSKVCTGKPCSQVTESFSTTPQPISPCPPGQVWDDCIVTCSHICYHLAAKMRAGDNPCSSGEDCISGCRAIGLNCPVGKFLRDENTCVEKKDCPCLSSSNLIVKPGEVVHESECDKCQCVNNEYECTFVCSSPVAVTHTTDPSFNITQKRYTVTPGMEFGQEGNVTLIYHTTPSPSAFCPSGQYESLIDDFTKFSASSQLESSPSDIWTAGMDNGDQYLQLDLGRVEPIYAVNVAGASGQYVTGYHLLYSLNGNKFVDIINQEGKKEIFGGPFDGHDSVKQVLPVPVEAKYIRFHPVSWHGGISMKVDVLGCKESLVSTTPVPTICNKPIGIGQKYFPKLQITVTSSKPNTGPDYIGFDNEKGWQPLTNSKSEWVQLDFGEFVNFTGIITKGVSQGEVQSWVERYKVQYSPDGLSWNPILDEFGDEMTFMGNTDCETERKNFFKRPIHAKVLKIQPVKWHENIALRLDVMGCYTPHLETEATPPGPLKSDCNVCKGALDHGDVCKCSGDEWWNGEKCVDHTECPCFAGLIAYPVGTTFTTERCEECICRLYGIPHCTPKQCEDCSQGLQKVLTPLCGCTCKPCEENTRLCPTSNVCLEESAWCDGIQDCPDDELHCTTPAPVVPPTPKPCLVSCPPGYEIVYANKTAGPSEAEHAIRNPKVKSIKSVKTYRKKKKSRKPAKPEKLTQCPPYDCVPVEEATPTECPPPECPIDYSVIYKKSVKALEGSSCPLYACEPVPEFANCSVLSKNIKTFDGTEYKYEICDHVLATHDSGLWNVTMLKNCSLASPCTSSLLIHHGEHTLQLHSHNRSIVLDSFVYSASQVELLNSKIMDFTLNPIGNSIIFKSDVYGFALVHENNGNVKITVNGQMKGHLNGLCGLYNGHPADDKTLPDGKLSKTVVDFGDSWLNPGGKECVETVCPVEMQNIALEVCLILRKEPFTSCGKEINLEPCIEATCNCLTGGDTVEECRCQALSDFATKCKSPDLFGWRWELGCPSSCPPNLVHYDCYPYACQPTCGNEECAEPATDCYSGCFCPDGLVKRGEECIQVPECRDCVCSGMGDSTYLTFDGGLTFNGNCTYVATRKKTIEPGIPAFEVLISNKLCNGSDFMTCTEKVEVKVPEHSIKLIAAPHTEEKVIILVDGLQKSHEEVGRLEETWSKVSLNPETSAVHVELPKEHVDVRFFYSRFAFTISLPSHYYSDKVEGLCGSCSQSVVEPEEIDNPEVWQTGKDENCMIETPTQCSPTPEHEKLCLYMKDPKVFGQCLALVDPMPFVDQCLTLLCLNEHVCNSLEAYGQACRDVGICVDWRSQDFCPFTCPSDLEYHPCKSGCHKTCENYEDVKESCTKPPVEGCFCPEDQILIDGTCKAEKFCEYCDEDGQHYEGDYWQVDKCTNCSCTDHVITCDKTECPPAELSCGEDEKLTREENDLECCPRHKCVCKAHEECPKVEIPEEPLPPGMEAIVNETGCCPRVEIVCRQETCPQPDPCKPHFVQKDVNTTGCCPEHVCEKAENVCVYQFESKSSGGHERIEREAKEEVVKEVGERWSDGPCKSCICVQREGYSEAVCTITECPTLEEHPDFKEYELGHVDHPDKCCPEVARTNCKHKGRIYQVGDSWMPDENDPCVTLKCNDWGEGLVVKETRLEVCDKDCDPGWEYQHAEGQCCGHCIQTGCPVEDKVYNDGESWFSPDKCSKSTCVKKNGHFTVATMVESCPSVEDCPPEDVYEDGCCLKCKIRAAEKHICAPQALPPEATLQLIREKKGKHGECTNRSPVANFTQCLGNCESYTLYNPGTGLHDSVCKCCRPQEFSLVTVELKCEDGLEVRKGVTVPSKCACTPCAG